jgi:deoxyadenosine/deoxycytidine kinase
MGAGKTTLARGLAGALGWSYLPEPQAATRMLTDLFRDPKRWAFEVQSAFLVKKAVQLGEALESEAGIVLDRTLYEDADIFARWFYKTGKIDERSYQTYRSLAEHFFGELRSPDVVILCQCAVDVAWARLKRRPGNVLELYPPNHLEEISALYREWVTDYNRSHMLSLDTEAFDVRTRKTIESVTREILAFLVRSGEESSQLGLFGVPVERSPQLMETLKTIHLAGGSPKPHAPPRTITPDVRVMPYPSAFVAAPFTEYAPKVPPKFEDAGRFLSSEPEHGIITDPAYRDFLLKVEKALRQLGIRSFIPHRDVNAWGERGLSASQVVSLCSSYVARTDLFVGVLGTSHGVHYEFGLARGLGKPAIILRVGAIPESFVSKGTTESLDDVLTVAAPTFDEAPAALLSPEVYRFLSRYLPLVGGPNT